MITAEPPHESSEGRPRPPPGGGPQQRILNRCCILISQLTLSEMSGSVGDLGTFIPLVVGLARQDAIAIGPTLFWAGFANLVTGCAWDIPMCVQPMKAIAAVAIAQNWTQVQVSAAGTWMGLFMVLLGVTNGIQVLNWLVPTPVVSGIQMGVGINLAIRGVQLIQHLSWWDGGLDCIFMSLLVAAFSLYGLRDPTATRPPAPVGLYLFGLGMLLALIHLVQNLDDQGPNFQWSARPVVQWALKDATWQDWKRGLLEGAIPQLPLTTLNSVISVCCLAHTLYPEKRRLHSDVSSTDAVVSRRALCCSVGIMNLLLCPLGAMPSCHGAGGLAGQHKFGARHGASVIFLGTVKMLVAVLAGSYLLSTLEALPTSILGLMLVVCGHELALTGWTVLVEPEQRVNHDSNESNHPQDPPPNTSGIPPGMKKGAVVALITVIVEVGLHKTHYSALSGWAAYMIYGDGARDYWAQWNGRRSTQAESEYSPIRETRELEPLDPLEGDD